MTTANLMRGNLMTAQENTTRILRTCDEKRKTGICRVKYEGMSGRETRGDKERQCRTVWRHQRRSESSRAIDDT